jgi:hypothetical protein
MATRGKKDVDDALQLALAAGGSVAAAARQANCSEKTVRRRLSDPRFRDAVRQMRADLVTKAVGRLAAMGVKAADGLNALMDNAKREQTRLGACRATLDFLFRGTELVEMEARIAALEAAAAAREKHK